MPNFNIPVTATAEEVVAAQYFLAEENERNAADNILRAEDGLELLPIYDGPIDYIQSKITNLTASWLQQYNAAQVKELRDAWSNATNEEKAAVRTALGI